MIPGELYGRDAGALCRSGDTVGMAFGQTGVGEGFRKGRGSPGASFSPRLHW